jgi:hypothetical protein
MKVLDELFPKDKTPAARPIPQSPCDPNDRKRNLRLQEIFYQ